ncbi:MAG: DNA polymerase III subunit delta, partial [Pseudomonadota bacterium]
QSRSSAWFKAIDQAGVVVLCWPVRPNELPGWLHGRFASRGLSADAAACRALASRVEGNLLAAAQEVDKLALSHPEGEITAAQVEEAVSDNARFDVFKLSDAALLGELPRAVRVARGLRAEGAPLPIVAWALTRETRLLLTLRETLSAGGNVQAVYRANAVWDARKALLQRAMRRMDDQALGHALDLCAELDRQVKGLAPGDPWLTVENILALLCQGRRVLAAAAVS